MYASLPRAAQAFIPVSRQRVRINDPKRRSSQLGRLRHDYGLSSLPLGLGSVSEALCAPFWDGSFRRHGDLLGLAPTARVEWFDVRYLGGT
jgi:hypothetical protein